MDNQKDIYDTTGSIYHQETGKKPKLTQRQSDFLHHLHAEIEEARKKRRESVQPEDTEKFISQKININ